MSDEPVSEPEPETPEAPAEDVVIADEEALRNAIAEHDAGVDREVRRLTRRGFIVGGVAAVAGYGAWKFLRLAHREGGVPWPLRRGLEANERISEAYFSTHRLARTFPPAAITNARINGGEGLEANYDPAHWRLRVEGIDGQAPATLTMSDIQSFPRRDMITELKCIEGWSIIVHWTGTRLSDLMQKFPPPRGTKYVAMESPGNGYYVGLDMLSCLHPQTLLAYGINGAPLSWQHGASLRLSMPVKYGYKQIKRIATIRYTNVRPPDFWAERGYDWYGGH
jgi:hypothetical protein